MNRQIKKTGYTYDESGNRLTKTTESGALTYTYNDDNRLADVEGDAGGMAYLYDEAGAVVMKVTNDKDIGYTYDTAGRLIRWADGATTVTFGYNGDGNRVWKSVNGVKTRYINDINSSVPQVLVETTDNYGVVAKYFYANGERLMQVRGNQITYYVYDMPGRSVVALTDTSGTVQNSYTYDSFGNIVMQSETVTNDFKYDGEQYDKETGLIYLRHRYYDPETGRFTSKDPFPGYITDPATINPYPFVGNNPVNYIDPLGLYWFIQPGQCFAVGTLESLLVRTGRGIGAFIDLYFPAGHTFGVMHDIDVGNWMKSVPKDLINIPTMPVVAAIAIGREVLNTIAKLVGSDYFEVTHEEEVASGNVRDGNQYTGKSLEDKIADFFNWTTNSAEGLLSTIDDNTLNMLLGDYQGSGDGVEQCIK